jgi:dolichyl-phosphate beta-glucosyltransferase
MSISVDIIIPSYNKKESINQTLAQLDAILENREFNFSIILVIDGDDGSVDILNKKLKVPLKLLVNNSNEGKGFSLKKGILNSVSEFVVFFDADLDIDPEVILKQLDLLASDKELAAVVGAKNLPESIVEYPLKRKILSSMFRFIVKLLFFVDILDSQTGVKSFRRSEINGVIDSCQQKGFIFELELLIILNYSKKLIKYTPVKITHRYNSSIKFFTPIRIFLDLLVLKFKFILISKNFKY